MCRRVEDRLVPPKLAKLNFIFFDDEALFDSATDRLAVALATDIDWIRKLWPGKLVIKGILDVDDAKTAVAAGADGIVVSNHGGRQLDGAPATIAVLPAIANAVGERTEVLFDGGIRSGQDVMKALALGARGCMIGRAHLYGLAAMGEAGVRAALKVIRDEMDITMMLTGVKDVREVTRDILYEPGNGRDFPRN